VVVPLILVVGGETRLHSIGRRLERRFLVPLRSGCRGVEPKLGGVDLLPWGSLG
jgi:hypothetical protein